MTQPQAVRLAWGALHLGAPTGRGYRTICSRTLEGEDLVVYWGRTVGRAWRLEITCRDCEKRLAKALAVHRRRR